VDARDLGAFLVTLGENRTGGIFNATGPAEPITLGETLERIGGGGRLVWVDEQTVLEAGVEPWMELPLWVPGDDDGFLRADISRALAAGISFRPLEETARDTLAWSLEAGEQRPTLSPEKERQILERWKSQASG
jgi:2'-hydroxyisoflavone reductase